MLNSITDDNFGEDSDTGDCLSIDANTTISSMTRLLNSSSHSSTLQFYSTHSIGFPFILNTSASLFLNKNVKLIRVLLKPLINSSSSEMDDTDKNFNVCSTPLILISNTSSSDYDATENQQNEKSHVVLNSIRFVLFFYFLENGRIFETYLSSNNSRAPYGASVTLMHTSLSQISQEF